MGKTAEVAGLKGVASSPLGDNTATLAEIHGSELTIPRPAPCPTTAMPSCSTGSVFRYDKHRPPSSPPAAC